MNNIIKFEETWVIDRFNLFKKHKWTTIELEKKWKLQSVEIGKWISWCLWFVLWFFDWKKIDKKVNDEKSLSNNNVGLKI